MSKNNMLQMCIDVIESRKMFQPLLFTSSNLKGFHIELALLIEQLFQHFWVDSHHIFILPDDGETLKIETIRQFIAKSHIRSSQRFQIFLIENISRLSVQSANACLKFLEEPGEGNVVFLTNTSESWVLETILSRVKHISLQTKQELQWDPFFLELLEDFYHKKNTNLLTYFYFDKKRQKEEYSHFFVSLLFFAKKYNLSAEVFDEIEQNLSFLEQTSIAPKYLVDRILLLLHKINIW